MTQEPLLMRFFTIVIILPCATAVVLEFSPIFIQHSAVAQEQHENNLATTISSSSLSPSNQTDLKLQTLQTSSLQSSHPQSTTPLSLTDIFKKVENSVVQITSTVSNPNELIIINGKRLNGNSTALGSGFIYDNKGHIVTNNHAVPDLSNNTNSVDVTFIDGNTYSAKVIHRDPFSDIAVLQLIGNFSDEKLVPLSITNSSTLQVGQPVIAIGNPFGLSGSMTTGIISQMARVLPNPDTGYSIANTIQTNAAINPGNSGGPLLNMQGQVIGMNTAIISDTGSYSGVGFAIPSDDIMHIVPKLIQNRSYSHPWLGIAGGKITPEISEKVGFPKNYKGVMIAAVQSGSPAEKAGLRGFNQNISNGGNITRLGDIITAVDGHPVRQMDEIINYLEAHKSVGDRVEVKVMRDAKIMDLTINLKARPITTNSQNQTLEQTPQTPQVPESPPIP
jgi:S1-C subfamily serine protease